MENCTIYSHHLEFDKVVNIVKSKLPKAKVEFNDGGKQKSLVATIKGGLFGKTKTLKINYRERENPSYKLDQIECALTQNLAGMTNFVQSFPAKNKSLQSKFLTKVMSANCEMPFMAEPGISEFAQVLKQIVNELDAFVFAQPNKVFNKSNGQHFLDDNLNLIIDQNGNSEIDDMDVNVEAKYHDEPEENYTEEQINRKKSSEAILNEKGIKVNATLPCIASSENTTLRSQDEVIKRVYALLIIAARGEGVNTEQLKKPIEDKQIDSFSPREQAILNTAELNDQEKAYATWRYESLYALLWALSIMPELKFADTICDVKDVVSKVLQPSVEDFTEACNLRSKDDILNELDKTYRMNWACVDARIKGQKVNGGIQPSIVYERHYALNWLTNYQDQPWDQVQTTT